MKLPKIFKDDIQSNNIQLIPLLIIERDANWADWGYNNTSIFLSTHDIHIPKAEEGIPSAEIEQSNPDGFHFSPLLLDTPVISEKIDVENRKYTISKCTFKISNHVYEGTRFSDLLAEDNLIGKKVNFAYKSINSSFPVGSMFLDQTGNNSWADLYDLYEYISPTFFFGEIRDIKHDNDTLTIIAEDLGSTFLHQEVPRNSLPNNDTVKENYRGSKIPMVYGYMPKSPVVYGSSRRVYADSRPIGGWWRNTIHKPQRYMYPFAGGDYSPLFISIDNTLCCISNNIYYELQHTKQMTNWNDVEDDPVQIEYVDDTLFETEVAKFKKNPLLSRNMMQLMVVYKPSITLNKRNSETKGGEREDPKDSLGDGDAYWGEDGDLLSDEELEYMTDGDFLSNYEIAATYPDKYCRSSAMVHYDGFNWTDQLNDNFYKHSLFRFLIDTEPPIEFINRGGTVHGSEDHWHWISFGHWVMPNQSSSDHVRTHNIYTYAKRTDSDLSFNQINNRFFAGQEFDNFDYDAGEEYYYRHSKPSEMNEETEDSWYRQMALGDIVRFSDYHVSPYSDNNPRRINWHDYEPFAESPLEFYGTATVAEGDTASDYDYEYTNPFAKFTNRSMTGEYMVDLGVYGWRNDEESTADDTDYYESHGGSLSPNFDYKGFMRGWLPEVTCMSVCDVKMKKLENMYGSIKGRINSGGELIEHPADIIADIFVNELGYSASKINQESLESTKQDNSHDDWKFGFSQAEAINSKDLIEDIAKSTFMFPRIGFDGSLKFPQIKRKYNQEDLDNSILIDTLDIISYKYNLTKRQDLVTATHVKYDYDHGNDKYFGDENTKLPLASGLVTGIVSVSDEQASYHGIDNKDEHIKEFESKYLRSSNYEDTPSNENRYITSIRKFQNMSTHHYANRHLIIKCKLPLRYLNVEVGDYIRFNKLIDGIKAYGIDYTKLVEMNNQYIYPLFMCTSSVKSIEYVELELLQLHHLWFSDTNVGIATPDSIWNDIGEEQISSIYYDDIGSYLIEQEETDEEEEPVEEEILVGDITLNSYNEALYNYNTFNLIEGETEYPYQLFGDSQLLFIMQESEEYNFGDANTGIHSLFSIEHFRVKYDDSEEYVPITSWNDLLPAEFTTTNSANQNYTILEINHFNIILQMQHNYTYKLKNMQPNIGDPIQIGWELTVNQSDINYNNGNIIAAPFNEPTFPGSQFIIKNLSEYSIFYDSPHPISEPQISQLEQTIDPVLGDINGDGIVDINDLVTLMNLINLYDDTSLIVQESPHLDISGDGILNILDIILLLNIILGNE